MSALLKINGLVIPFRAPTGPRCRSCAGSRSRSRAESSSAWSGSPAAARAWRRWRCSVWCRPPDASRGGRSGTRAGSWWAAPNPGGGGTLKFSGATAQEAEIRAIAFVQEHIRLRGFQTNGRLAPVLVLPFAEEGAPGSATAPPIPVAPRKLRNLPVRFGIQRPSLLGTTINVSREGMFVGTDGPYDAGVAVRLRLDLDGLDVLLNGQVVWSRHRAEAGRPLGMGVRLAGPSPAYQRWVEMIA